MKMLATNAALSARHTLLRLALAFGISLPAFAQQTPALPQVFLDTEYEPPSGSVITVNSGGNLQTAINNAQLGDTIVLQAGATFTGNFTLPNKTGSGWIYIRSSGYDNLPPPGTRALPSHATHMAKIKAPLSGGEPAGPAIQTLTGAHHYRFVGIEITTDYAQRNNSGLALIRLGDHESSVSNLPSDIVFDRCYIHGTATGNVRRGIELNSRRTAVIDSYISNIHEVGFDAQAIGGWNGPGPYKIVNNYLEGSGENVMFGGATPDISTVVPSDIEIRHNHFFKPLSWKVGHSSYAGIEWSIKNLFEIKSARRVLFEANILENNWLHAQRGMAIVLTLRGEDNQCPQCDLEDVTIVKNILRNSWEGIHLLGTDYNSFLGRQSERILIKDNLLYGIDNLGIMLINDEPTSPPVETPSGTRDVVIDHNTLLLSGASSESKALMFGDSHEADDRHQNLVIRNNLMSRGTYGMLGSGVGEGTPALCEYASNWTFGKNVIIGASSSSYPPNGASACTPNTTGTNYFPATVSNVGFVDAANHDYRLSSGSAYNNLGTDSKDLGADVDAVMAATAGVTDGTPGEEPPPSGQSPYTGTPFQLPGLLQAENFDNGGEGVAYHDTTSGNSGGLYRTSEDVDLINPPAGNSSGYVVNDFQTGEWLEYTINVPTAWNYTIRLRASSVVSNSQFRIEIDGVNVTGTLTVPNTGALDTFTYIGLSGIALTAGTHVVRVHVEQQHFHLDAIRFLMEQAPYTGTPFQAPGVLQAEDFDIGGELVAYHDNAAGNAGGEYRTAEDVDIIDPASGNSTGYVVNNFETGEWLEYTVDIPATGDYTLELHASSELSNSSFHIELSGVNLTGSVAVPNTGSWNTFQYVGVSGIHFNSGHRVLRVFADQQYFNLDAIRITQD